MDECNKKPCQHGRCVNKDGGYKCTCSPGWTGQNCQQDIDECKENPCHHGRCVNREDGYKCTCSPGWTGQNCDQDIDECNKNPCQHGRCVNKDGGYDCTCSPGWTGRNCHQALRCQAEWSKYNNHCYKLMTDKVCWVKAKTGCEKHGANLASIKDVGENNFITGLIKNAPEGILPLVWVGLKKQSGQWKWTDGSRVGYKNWAPHEPNDILHKEDCGNMYSKVRSSPFLSK
ncbi:snaclec anticoagulant protein subunit A-like [Branchiostoma floridae x Branchiostoma belcheri]